MDETRFDQIARALGRGASRRAALAALAAAALPLAGAAAKKKKRAARCGPGKPCPPGQVCDGEGTSKARCLCPDGRRPCGDVCCDAAYPCNDDAANPACVCPATLGEPCNGSCCPAGQVCRYGACVQGCTGAAECAAGEGCAGGGCCPDERACGSTCCAEGLQCRGALCLPPAPCGQAANSRCTTDADCCGLAVCETGRCYRLAGVPCEHREDCTSNRCGPDHTCECARWAAQCRRDADCCDGFCSRGRCAWPQSRSVRAAPDPRPRPASPRLAETAGPEKAATKAADDGRHPHDS